MASGEVIRRQPSNGRLGVIYKLLILLYVLGVVILSSEVDQTIYAKILGLCVGGLFAFRVISGPDKVFFPAEYRMLVVWFLFSIICSLLSSHVSHSLAKAVSLLQVYPMAFVLSNLIYWNGSARFFWIILVVAAAASGVIGLSDPIRYSGIDGRFFGTLEHPSAFACLMVVAAMLCLSQIVGQHSRLLKAGGCLLAVSFLYLLSRSGSRTGAIAAVAALIPIGFCIIVCAGKGISKKVIALLLGVLLIVGTFLYLTSSRFSSRFDTLFEVIGTEDVAATNEVSLIGRIWMYQRGLELFAENPVFGLGLDAYRGRELAPGLHIRNNLHSNYIEMLANTGFLGTAFYYSIYYWWWRRLIRSRELLRDRHYAVPITVGVSIATIFVAFDFGWVTYYDKLPWLVFAGLVAEVNLIRSARPARFAS